MVISLIHPSKSRPEKALTTFTKWMNLASGENEIEHILSIDLSDRRASDYYPAFKNSRILINDNQNLVQAANVAAKESKGDILILLSDDFECPQNWDKLIVQAFEGQTDKLLKTNDGIQKWIATLYIADRAFYESEGYIYHPDYLHLFCDTDLSHKAELQGKKIVRNDLVFKHIHHSGGLANKDEINHKAEATWNQGQALYLKRCREKFGLGDIDIFNLSPDATDMINWLRGKL